MHSNRPKISDHWWMDSQPPIVKKNTISPSASDLSFSDIEELAVRAGDKLNYKYDGNLAESVRRAGGEIRYTDFWAYHGVEKGSIYILGAEKFTIWLSERASRRMNAFTIAHELGHYFVHYAGNERASSDGRFMIAARYETGDVESQADLFAVNFLAPRALVKTLAATHSLHEISKKLCVDRYVVEKQLR